MPRNLADVFNGMQKWNASELAFLIWAKQDKGVKVKTLVPILQRSYSSLTQQLFFIGQFNKGKIPRSHRQYTMYDKAISLAMQVKLNQAKDLKDTWLAKLHDNSRIPGEIKVSKMPPLEQPIVEKLGTGSLIHLDININFDTVRTLVKLWKGGV